MRLSNEINIVLELCFTERQQIKKTSIEWVNVGWDVGIVSQLNSDLTNKPT